ncbi:YheC/YheD family protein [Bacillus sp. DTU_2020_1000418_1_SI_GHA_SEK_038]|uniref:YheC/YheD family protein n=1 Tax=Bacillus sp. DTU_2020_1000418_1_SI_GHA_SEK_038 TaxID=3077585 RepID=UPI0028E561E7|nr:YheC/YheD family protein [Bacillus sp. DTU_2020_1000418_1_SI_GHA_SEK_038]WNS75835.1 YheC/YheD family protein [Bacillus sp. DTU_2020_1000418_1_SI_GHA_SEK_038]
MKERLGKWRQYTLLSEHPLLTKYIPETKLYTTKNLTDLLDRYEYVYLKNDRGGQGKGIFKVYRNKNGLYCFNGYSLDGKKIQMDVVNIKDFEPHLHPINRFGGYIVQEGIQSITPDGFPLSIRVHAQILRGEWLIGGIYGKIATEETTENGVINANRGAQVMTIDTLLSEHLKMRNKEKNNMIKLIMEASAISAKVAASAVPQIEYGIDFGINQFRKPVIFEINTSPGVGNFSKIGNGEMRKRIKAIRKMHLEDQIGN